MAIKPQPQHKPVARAQGAVAPLPPVAPKPVVAATAAAQAITYPEPPPQVSKAKPSVAPVIASPAFTSSVANAIARAQTNTAKPFEVFFHRSGHETYWYCPRAYYLNYHYLGTGIYKAPMPLHLEVGSAVHLGFASILKGNDIEHAVQVAQQYLMHGECFPFLNSQYEQQEQLCLVAGLLYSFHAYMWPSFSKQFEVLYVERGVIDTEVIEIDGTPVIHAHRMSRPDAIVRDRVTREVVGISLKTINDLTEWRRTQFHNDLQGLTEMYNAELMFSQIREAGADAFVESWLADLPTKPTYAQIKQQIALWESLPMQVDYIQTIFLVKGVRKPFGEQDEVQPSDDYGKDEKEFRQHSPLCYYWRNNGESNSAPHWSWAARYYKADNKSYSRLGKGFDRVSVWTLLDGIYELPDATNKAVREWVHQLNSQKVFPSTEPDDRNIRNPLSQIVVYDEPMYRDHAQMQSVVERQVAKVQTKIAFDLYDIANFQNAGLHDDAQALIDSCFDQHLVSCRQPYRCQFQQLCHNTPPGWMDHKTMPEGYAERKPHHEFESETRTK